MPFRMIREDWDTRIHECDEKHFEKSMAAGIPDQRYETVDDAKTAAIAYLQDLIVGCQGAIEEIKHDNPFRVQLFEKGE
jgi:hypothetical protein